MGSEFNNQNLKCTHELVINFYYNGVVFTNLIKNPGYSQILSKFLPLVLYLLFAQANAMASDFNLTEERVIASEADQWLVHGRTYDEQRFSPLDQINTETIKDLGIAWFIETSSNRGHEASPIVIDGVMFATAAWGVVYATNAKSGELLWTYDPKVPREQAFFACCDVVNRGVAVWQGKVFLGTLDGRLIALDANTGELIWETMTVDDSKAYSITGAPRVIKGKVLIGNGGAEYGVRGYVSAYDSATGALMWRFYTVPDNPENGFESEAMRLAASTWSGNNWWTLGGGGTVWDSMAYDPELDLVYIGTGNGSPWNHEERSPGGGDNLFLSSIVALKPDNGEYVWHYQTTPGDNWDYTATQHMILADIEIAGNVRKVIMQAPKNGFFYVIDRTNGKLISAENYVKVNWASHVDLESGKPVPTGIGNYEKEDQLVFPGPLGGHNWQPMSYNPNTGLVYIPAIEMYFPFSKDKAYSPKQPKIGELWNTAINTAVIAPPKGLLEMATLIKSVRGRLSAWDPVQQKEVWSNFHTLPWNGGTLTTAGNLVFQGTSDGELIAFQAQTGKKLWSKDLKTGIIAPPISYAIDGKQYITVLAGYGGVFALEAGLPPKYSGGPINGRIITFSLDSDLSLPNRPPNKKMPYPPESDADQITIANGEVKYHAHCFICHGAGAIGGGVISDLRYMNEDTHSKFNAIVLGGLYTDKGMVSFAESFTQEEAEAVHAYLIQRAKETYYLETLNSFLK